jgi:hypothetical protein
MAFSLAPEPVSVRGHILYQCAHFGLTKRDYPTLNWLKFPSHMEYSGISAASAVRLS